ncbi:SHQ1 protein-domain-containing protein [Piptocephalis cylindrospora]|uniref:SHQ1 protein-domain-containing protein n=1 Tax=Piptocephalis cylindrospora TaxID=1907219 RepID=A0A4P9Y3I4_9FUNG|nr:SHQ1 protein-domain-containing protein [Piptocephalis cylindrospora]|eukprot:RKP13508.1 SHQ1 protein-domain-containing protein [Piptocephalis cylindrospora]
MITPKFSVDQDQEFVKVEIHAPHIRATDVELYIEGDEFKFHLAPYFLRLHLPGRVVEDDRATSSYDVAAGIITCKLPKETPGETFEGLDMLTTLLARRVERPQGPLIEVLEEDGGEDMKHESMDEKGDPAFSEAKEFDWQLPQNLPEEPLTEALGGVKYGFNRAYSGYFLHWRERSVDEVCEILDPEITALSDRVEQRETMENGKFDEDYYIADMVNAEDYAHVLQYRTGWWKALRDIQRKASSALTLSSKDQEMMLQLPRKEYLLDDEKTIYLGLVDLLFAYSYDHRVNEGEPTVESAWLISKLSASISGFMVRVG